MLKELSLALLATASFSCTYVEAASKYDMVTSTKAMVATQTLSSLDNSKNLASVSMYSPYQMNSLIENSQLFSVVRDVDKCEFTRDIEDRARLVKSPVFMYAWGEMLLNGVCVRKDQSLGLSYIQKAAENSYAPAMVQLSKFFEKGVYLSRDINLSKIYMHTAAALGSKSARLGWADMLVRGLGQTVLFEEAYSWLYHSSYGDKYSQDKKHYLEEQLKKHLPPHIVAKKERYTANN